MEALRKSAQEVEIDHLLAEEFSCAPTFAERFIEACGLPCRDYVLRVIPEPSMGGEGFGDLLVEGKAEARSVALLIEDKITASPTVRQAERYAAHAQRLRSQGWDEVWTIIVAPGAYVGERDRYDGNVNLETVASLLRSPELLRLSYRRGIIERALIKKAASGVQIPDTALHQLKSEYLKYASEWCAAERFDLEFPALRQSYYDGDSWVEPIRCPKLPDNAWLRHRLWTAVTDERGLVDLIVAPANATERSSLRKDPLTGAIVGNFSKGKGVQVSLRVPEMRQSTGFDHVTAMKAFQSMRALVSWYMTKGA